MTQFIEVLIDKYAKESYSLTVKTFLKTDMFLCYYNHIIQMLDKSDVGNDTNRII